ncbi:MAG: hypothetical protein LUD48_07435, partial [Prevotella sp.]|nr:hypothetical protein [Prevotella sp.]
CLFSLASATAWADEGFDLTANPENGSTVKELSSFSVCGYVEYMDLYDWDTRVEVVKDGEVVAYADYDGVGENDEGYNEVIFAIDNEDWDAITLTEAGEYTITIPAEYLKGGDEEAVYNNATILTYTIVESAGGETDASEGFDLTFDPEDGSTLTQLNSLTICGNSDEMDYNDWDAILYVVKDGETVAIANWYGSGEDEDGNNVFYYEIVDTEEWEGMTLTEEGTYTIEIPAGLFHIGDALSNAVTLTYTIGEVGSDSGDYSYTVSPAAGVLTETTSTITISCETGMYVVDGSLSNIKVYKDGELYTTATGITPVNPNMYCDEGEAIELEIALSEKGEYEVVIPAGFFYYFVDGRTQDIDMGKITINYTISETTGINSIDAALSEGINEVYNLSGQRIQSMQNGKVNVVKFSDGSVKKIIVK